MDTKQYSQARTSPIRHVVAFTAATALALGSLVLTSPPAQALVRAFQIVVASSSAQTIPVDLLHPPNPMDASSPDTYFTCDGDWVIGQPSLDPTPPFDPTMPADWVQVSPSSGHGNPIQTSFIFDANPTAEVRVARFEVTCDGSPIGWVPGDIGELRQVGALTPAPVASIAASSFTPGGEASVTGTGFVPGETVTATMHSDPYLIGTQPADLNGDAAFTWTIPASTVPGDHTVELAGSASGTTTATFQVAYAAASPAVQLTGLTIAGGSLVRPSGFDGRRTVYWVKPTTPTGGAITVTASAPTGASLSYTLDGAPHTGNVFNLNLSASKLMSEIGIIVTSGGLTSNGYYLDVAVQDPTSYQVAKQYYPALKPYNSTTTQTRVLVDQFDGGSASPAQMDFIARYLEGSQKNTANITGPVLAQNPQWHSLHYHLAIWNNPNAWIIWNDTWTNAETAQLMALAQADPNVFMYAVDKRTSTSSVIRDVSPDATYLMNITNDTYYNWVLANIIDQCRTDNYDSVFLDSYNMDTVYSFTGGNYVYYDGTDMMTYQDPQLGGLTWAQASEEFMARLTRDLNRAGIWSLPNIGNQRTTWDPIDYAYSNGGMFEQAPETPTAAHGDWQQDMSRYIYLSEKGKVLIYQNYSVTDFNDAATRLYVTAAYQMARANYTYVNEMVRGQAQASWYPEYDIGAMLGAPTQTVTGVPDAFSSAVVDPLIQQYAIGNNLYERKFQNGLVVINADSSGASHAFTVPSDGNSYVSVTIQPGSGGTVTPDGGISALTGASNYPLVKTPVNAGQVITLPGNGALILIKGTGTAQPQTLTFTSASVTKTVGDAPFTNVLTHDGGGTVTFTSSNPGVATVSLTGEVTIVSAGTTTITANAAAVPGTWQAASASYTLIVNPKVTTGTAMYRIMNPSTGEHFYTSSAKEVQVNVGSGAWKYEGIGWFAPTSGTQVYRLAAIPGSGSAGHLFTTSTKERDAALASRNPVGQPYWKCETGAGMPACVGWYSGGTIPVFRAFYPGSGQHNYTTDTNEQRVITTQQGWKDEGIGWYGVQKGDPRAPMPV